MTPTENINCKHKSPCCPPVNLKSVVLYKPSDIKIVDGKMVPKRVQKGFPRIAIIYKDLQEYNVPLSKILKS